MKTQESYAERLQSANQILATFVPGGFLHRYRRRRSWRLGLCTEHGRAGRVEIQRSSGSLAGRYGKLGLGGTQACAVGQLVLWLRAKPRRPILFWEHWASDRVQLCGSRTVELLRNSSYGSEGKTLCVLCRAAKPTDWWWFNVMGPCCSMARCRTTYGDLG